MSATRADYCPLIKHPPCYCPFTCPPVGYRAYIPRKNLTSPLSNITHAACLLIHLPRYISPGRYNYQPSFSRQLFIMLRELLVFRVHKLYIYYISLKPILKCWIMFNHCFLPMDCLHVSDKAVSFPQYVHVPLFQVTLL